MYPRAIETFFSEPAGVVVVEVAPLVPFVPQPASTMLSRANSMKTGRISLKLFRENMIILSLSSVAPVT
jgi:hypothetical protein